MSLFSFFDMMDGETQMLLTPCHKCGHKHHCNREQCKECECTECDCDNCRARKQGRHPDQIEVKTFK